MKENQNTEWKQSWCNEYLKWVCGFANAEGGKLVIGRDDERRTYNQRNAQVPHQLPYFPDRDPLLCGYRDAEIPFSLLQFRTD